MISLAIVRYRASGFSMCTIPVNEHDEIYDFLTGIGYAHEAAADIASWAELASVGEHYGDPHENERIWIIEEDAE